MPMRTLFLSSMVLYLPFGCLPLPRRSVCPGSGRYEKENEKGLWYVSVFCCGYLFCFRWLYYRRTPPGFLLTFRFCIQKPENISSPKQFDFFTVFARGGVLEVCFVKSACFPFPDPQPSRTKTSDFLLSLFFSNFFTKVSYTKSSS